MNDERQNLERAKGGDRAALRQIFEAHKREMYGLALGYTGNHHDAEDVVQESFYKFYRTLARFRGEAKVGSWLYRITVNVCLDRARKHQPLLAKRDSEDEPDPMDAVADSDPRQDPERMRQSGELRHKIRNAVAGLSPLERSVFVLRHYRELPLLEIARVIERSEGTVKNVLFRALRKLRNQLEPLPSPSQEVKP